MPYDNASNQTTSAETTTDADRINQETTMDANLVNSVTNRSWGNPNEHVVDLVQQIETLDIPLDEMVGGFATKTVNTLAIPLIVSYEDSTKRTIYRAHEDGMLAVPDGKVPEDSSWLEVDPRMSLKRALDLYGRDLLVFEKTHRQTSLEIMILPVRQRNEQAIRILVRKPSAPTQAMQPFPPNAPTGRTAAVS